MAETRRPGGVPPHRQPELPPGLPPEYAEAYRRGYQQALSEGSGRAGAAAAAEQTVRLERRQVAATSRGGPSPWARRLRRGTMATVLLASAVGLVFGAYYAGSLFADRVGSVDVTAEEPSDGLILGESAGDDEAQPNDGEPRYDGPVARARVSQVNASCQSPDSADAAGNTVSYQPANAYDGRLVTAWRCVGDGRGETISLTFPAKTRLGEVGLVPGYAKTDRRSGVDRFAQNNRVTEVRWVLGKKGEVVQNFSGEPGDRDLRTLRIPEVKVKKVTVEIVSTTGGERNTTAVSEIWLGEATG